MSNFGIVSTGHKRVTEIACEILNNNGNAFDAIVGAGFASSVLEPTLTGLAGGGYLLASNKTFTKVYDFFSDLPGRGKKSQHKYPNVPMLTISFTNSDQDFGCDPPSIAVPGTLLGYLKIHRDLGSLPLKEILAPTIEVARKGHPLNRVQAYTLCLLSPILTRTSEGKKLFEDNGKPKTEGTIFKNEHTANFLEQLGKSKDPETFFRDILKDDLNRLRKDGCLITEEDVDHYEVICREPLNIEYRDHQIFTNPAPSLGGSLLKKAFEFYEPMDLSDLSWGSTDHLHAICESLRKTEGVKNEVYRKIFSRGTTHATICDKNGNIASMSTSNGEGCGHFLANTGIMFNNIMGEDDLFPTDFHPPYEPGTRIGSMMSPTLVKDPQGKTILALGTGGSKRIRSAIFQVISHIVDFKVPLKTAIESPRIHFESNSFQIEPGFSKSALEDAERNQKIKIWDQMDLYFGGVHAIAPEYGGAADPRRMGFAKVVR